MNTTQLAVVLAIMTLMSKLLGFTRELFLANYFGATAITDAYTMSLSIPSNLLSGIMGAAGTAFLPVYSRKMEDEGRDQADLFTSQIMNMLLAITAVITVIGWIFAVPLVKVFAPGFTPETVALTAYYMRVAFIFVFFAAISQILEAYLNYRGIFIPEYFFNYAQNVVIIGFIITSAKLNMPKMLIYGITIGWFIIAAGKFFLAKKTGYKYKASLSFSEPIKEIVELAVPVFIGNSAIEINSLIDRVLASNLVEGSVSALNYGSLFSAMFTGLTVSVFVAIIYPRLTQAFSKNDLEKIGDISERGINLVALIMVPCTMGAIVYANPAIQVVYERGAFNGAATELTAAAFLFYSIGMTFTATRTLLDKVFYSVCDTKTPVMCSVIGVVVNIVLNLILVRFMAHAGLALATSISQVVSALLEYALFRKKHPEITLLKSKRKLVKIFIFSAISVAVSYAFYHFVGGMVFMPRTVLLGLAVIVAVAVYFVFLVVNKFDELSLIKDIFGRNQD